MFPSATTTRRSTPRSSRTSSSASTWPRGSWCRGWATIPPWPGRSASSGWSPAEFLGRCRPGRRCRLARASRVSSASTATGIRRSPRCSCTAAGSTSSATCGSCGSSGTTSRTRWDVSATSSSTCSAGWRRRRRRCCVNPASGVPMVGASGAISGVMGAYLVLYPRVASPHADLAVRVHDPHRGAGVLMLATGSCCNCSAAPPAAGEGGVAFWAHVGGFVAGAVLIPRYSGTRSCAEAPRPRPSMPEAGLPPWLAAHAGTHGLGRFIDHTLLKPEASRAQILALCDEGVRYGVKALCVNGVWLRETCATRLAEATSRSPWWRVFPSVPWRRPPKPEEAGMAVAAGASEIDMVIGLGAAKAGEWEAVEADVRGVVAAAGGSRGQGDSGDRGARATRDRGGVRGGGRRRGGLRRDLDRLPSRRGGDDGGRRARCGGPWGRPSG